jgi:hypothetical protein
MIIIIIYRSRYGNGMIGILGVPKEASQGKEKITRKKQHKIRPKVEVGMTVARNRKSPS